MAGKGPEPAGKPPTDAARAATESAGGAGAPAAGAWPPVAVGDVVAGYRLVRLLGSGGMGMVFEAMQEQIRRRVAVKIVRARAGAERFGREARAANAVEHPGIIRVHEAGQLEGGQGYIVMEYLDGETLGQRLRRGGGAGALGLLWQVAAALSAAHEQGVIHRDLKPENVMVLKDPLVAGGERAKVLDFGLAKLELDAWEGMEQTRSGVLMGTPLYMSPEQCRSAAHVDGKTDVYALGVMLYEALSGRMPFEGTGAELITAHLRDEPKALGEVSPEVPVELARLVERMLGKEPAERPAMGEVAQALKRLLTPDLSLLAPPRRGLARRARRLGRGWAWAAAVVAAATVAVLVGAGIRRLRPEATLALAKGKRTVAILGLEGKSAAEDLRWLGPALSEMLQGELAAATDRLRLLPGESVAQAKIELGLKGAESYAKEALVRVRRNIGPDLVVGGVYRVLGAASSRRLEVRVRLQETEGGAEVVSVTETGKEAELFELVARLGAKLRARFGAAALSEEEAAALAQERPTNQEAMRLYALGREKLRLYDAMGARAMLEQATKADPQFAQGYLALGEALRALGLQGKAKVALKQATELAVSLPREGRLVIEGQYADAQGQWDRAEEIYSALRTLYPENLEYGLRLSEMRLRGGRIDGARATVVELRRLRDGQDLRISFLEAGIAGDEPKARRHFAQVAERAQAQGAVLIAARAWDSEAQAAWKAGDCEGALRPAEEARRIYAAAGDRGSMAEAIGTLGNVSECLGQIERARELYEEWYRTQKELGNPGRAAVALGCVGGMLHEQARLALARKAGEEFLELARDPGNEVIGVEIPGTHLLLGHGAFLEGRLDEVARRFSEADRIMSDFRDDRIGRGWVKWHLGELLAAKGELREARRQHGAGLALRTESGLAVFMGESKLGIAMLDLEEGRLKEAEKGARIASVPFHESKIPHREAQAQAVLASVLLARGKAAEAQAAAARAMALLGKTDHVLARLQVGRRVAQVRAARGDPAARAAAVESLESLLREAEGLGLVSESLELRLALGQVQLAAGKREAARALLSSVKAEASRLGFVLIARKAAAAR